MKISVFLLILYYLSLGYAAYESQYECGPHGRFEYCIDDIPGCVIGCHCHPGYYFDTDTKICEPNIKLTQDFRRHYLSQPSRVQLSEPTSVTETSAPTPTTINPIDDKIDQITNDADDLGDWLYNQFFKTIENQVINNTNNDPIQLTRRSGSKPIKKKPKKKPRKFWKRTSKRRKPKHKKSLKRKLMRITEDDSLFQSDSNSGSDESDSSSSSDSESDTSSEREKSDRDHGHKKIVMYNKKPKPQLPSFIFLPNMDTPFYPPIGLHPPPAVPMYPMVPVPPVGSPYALSGFTPSHCVNDSTSDTVTDVKTTPSIPTTTTTAITTTTAATTTLATEVSPSSDGEVTPEASTPEGPGDKTPKPNKRRGGHPKYGNILRNKLKHGQKAKLLQKLREKMADRNKLSRANYPMNQYQDLDEPFLEDSVAPESFTYPKRLQSYDMDEDLPMEDVDFKYLTQLIHKANINNTDNQRLRAFSPKDRLAKPPQSLPARRNYNTDYDYKNNFPQSNLAQRIEQHRLLPRQNDADEAYYINLGRQIASMIRKLDSEVGDREVDIEIENTNPQTLNHPVFSENSYSPRNYWERSVRSPLKIYLKPNNRKFEYLKKSNENLFNLENKVEIAATTAPSLSLLELENIINTMKNIQTKIQTPKRIITLRQSNANFNINLLPKSEREPKSEQNIIKTNYERNPTEYKKVQSNTMPTHIHSVESNNFHKLLPLSNFEINKTEIYKGVPFNVTRKRMPSMINDSALKMPFFTGQVQFIRKGNKSVPKEVMKPYGNQYMPTVYHYNKYKNNNQYFYEKSFYPINPSILIKSNKPSERSVKPSYFHHELHHFDYFDE